MLNEIYSRRILELAANIPRLGRLSDAQGSAVAHSKLCGSTVTVDVKLEGDVVSDFAHEVRACALGQASAAVLGEVVIGRTLAELDAARTALSAMLKDGKSRLRPSRATPSGDASAGRAIVEQAVIGDRSRKQLPSIMSRSSALAAIASA